MRKQTENKMVNTEHSGDERQPHDCMKYKNQLRYG